MRHIVADAASDPARKRTRVTQRLTPIPRLAAANEEGLEQVARAALARDFHADPITPLKVYDV